MSSSKENSANKVRQFNDLFLEFIEKLIVQFPEIPKLSKFSGMFTTLRRVNNRGPLSYFIKGTCEYALAIMDKNEQVLINNEELLKEAGDSLKNGGILVDSGILDIWANIDQQSKDNIWLYLQGLTQLAFSINGVRGERNIRKFISSNTDIAKALLEIS